MFCGPHLNSSCGRVELERDGSVLFSFPALVQNVELTCCQAYIVHVISLSVVKLASKGIDDGTGTRCRRDHVTERESELRSFLG